MELLKKVYNFLFHFFGLNIKTLFALYKFPKMLRELIIFKKKGGNIDKFFPILYDYSDSAGSIKGHYFHQDIRVSSLIYINKPFNHLDIGGRIDGFISNLSVFMKVDILDIRNLNLNKRNINFIKGDLMDPKFILNKKYKLSHEDIAKAVGKKRVTISNALRLLKLPFDIRKSLIDRKISAGHARAILQAKSTSTMFKVWEIIVNKNLSVREAEIFVKKKKVNLIYKGSGYILVTGNLTNRDRIISTKMPEIFNNKKVIILTN